MHDRWCFGGTHQFHIMQAVSPEIRDQVGEAIIIGLIIGNIVDLLL